MGRRISNKLTALQLKQLPPGRHGDGGGLYLLVKPNGGRSWVFRFRWGDKRTDMGLGSYPDMSLAAARQRAQECRQMLLNDINPMAQKRQQRLEARRGTAITFERLATEYIDAHRPDWKNAKHASQWVNTIRDYANPVIGKLEPSQIDIHHIQAILEPIWLTKTETAKRLRGRIETILDYAAVKGLTDKANPAAWSLVGKLLPNPGKVQKVRHMPAMGYRDLPEFWAELMTVGGGVADGLGFLILTGARSNEVRGATYDEITFREGLLLNSVTSVTTLPANNGAGLSGNTDDDGLVTALPDQGNQSPTTETMVTPVTAVTASIDAGLQVTSASSPMVTRLPGAIWEVPAERMKAQRPHRVPLSMQALELVAMQPDIGSRLIFPGRDRDRPMSENTMRELLIRMGHRSVTVHGYRSSMRMFIAEQTSATYEVAEACLAHRTGSAVSQAYMRSDYLTERAVLMAQWANYVTSWVKK